jgi:hypothetical protein
MPWFKIDDQFAFHPKAIAAGNAALGLWVRAGSWCAAHLTQGALPAHMVRTLGAQRRDADKLVSVGLWMCTEDGYLFKDWDEYQPTKEQVEAKRVATRERVRSHRERQRNAVTPDVTNDVTNAVSTPTPSRPVPSTTSSPAPRPDVEELCEHLHRLLVAKDVKVNITQEWRDSARLLLDRDGRDLAEARRLIDWCQRDDFWGKNILSMPKFRKQYDQLRLKAGTVIGARSNGYVQPSKRLPAAWTS